MRLSFNVTSRVREQLGRLQEDCEAESLTEVLRRAFTVYEDLLKVRRDGGQVVLEHEDGRREVLRVF
ncbi:hypothetical protein [Engelhardtia mirabilis]|uniref:hypothetical protein n=1 Tax=Engelhardtia mirabilis TaxID=2528011 RepID=UPI0011A56EB4